MLLASHLFLEFGDVSFDFVFVVFERVVVVLGFVLVIVEGVVGAVEVGEELEYVGQNSRRIDE